MATKQDLRDLEKSMKVEMKSLEHRIDARFQAFDTKFTHQLVQLESKMTIKMGVMLTVAVGILATLQKLA